MVVSTVGVVLSGGVAGDMVRFCPVRDWKVYVISCIYKANTH